MATPLRFIRLADVETQVGLRKTAIYRKIIAGEFPAPILIGSASRWVETEIEEWMRARIDARDTRRPSQKVPIAPSQGAHDG